MPLAKMMSLVSIPLIMVVSSALAMAEDVSVSSLITVPRPGTGEPCSIDLEKIGPRELKVEAVASYLIRLENRSGCRLKLQLIDRYPEWTRFRRGQPEPSKVRQRRAPRGPKLVWSGLELRPGEVKLFEVGLHVKGGAGRLLQNQLCLKGPHAADHEFCVIHELRVLP